MSSLLKKISLNSSGQIQKTFVVFLNFQRPVSGEKPNTLKQTNNNGCEYVEESMYVYPESCTFCLFIVL